MNPRNGPGLFDDPEYLLGTLVPRYPGFDLGTEASPFKDLHLSGDANVAGDLNIEGDLTVDGALIGQGGITLPLGDALTFTAGANGYAGEVTVNGVTPVVVNTNKVTEKSIVTFGLKTVGGTVGNTPTVKSKVVGTSFSIGATASDTSTYTWAISETT